MSAKSCKVLIVDDNADGADSAACLLRMEGHEVEVAYEPKSALDKVRSLQPDVVLMDVALPGRTGIDLGKEVRTLLPQCRMVIVSGYTAEEIQRKAQEAGFNDFLIKPAEPEVLTEVVQQQCDEAHDCNAKDSP